MPGFMAAPSVSADLAQSGSPVQEGCPKQPLDDASPVIKTAAEAVMSVSPAEAQELPPVTLMSSTADIIVPWSVPGHASL